MQKRRYTDGGMRHIEFNGISEIECSPTDGPSDHTRPWDCNIIGSDGNSERLAYLDELEIDAPEEGTLDKYGRRSPKRKVTFEYDMDAECELVGPSDSRQKGENPQPTMLECHPS